MERQFAAEELGILGNELSVSIFISDVSLETVLNNY